METTYHSRWGKKGRRRKKDGRPIPLLFGPRDLEICRLLAPQIEARSPWAYQYLPTSYFAPLQQRGLVALPARVSELASEPYCYLELADQPKNNYRDQIYQLGNAGRDQLKEAGYQFPKYHYRKVPHELMACISAASFEIGARESGLTITPDPLTLDIYPDWPAFRINDTHVLLEVDLDSETLKSDSPHVSSISGKFEQYLKIIDDRTFNGMILFVTTRQTRVELMIDVLKSVIDKYEKGNSRRPYPHEYAEHFGFTHIEYDRWLSKIPKPSGRAVTQGWIRAGHEPFSFV